MGLRLISRVGISAPLSMEWPCSITVTEWPGTRLPMRFVAAQATRNALAVWEQHRLGTGMRSRQKEMVSIAPKHTLLLAYYHHH